MSGLAGRRRFLGAHANTGIEGDPYLVFAVSGDDYALPLLSVSEIVRADDVRAMPNAPEALRGVMTLRDRRVAVLDLAVAFGRPFSDDGSFILIAQDGDPAIAKGLAVDEVRRLLHLESAAIHGIPKLANVLDIDFIGGLAALDSGLVPILNLQRVLDLEPLREAFEAAARPETGEEA